MKTAKLLLLILFVFAKAASAQGDYMVKTAPQKRATGTPEEQFVYNNFPSCTLCEWKAGMKFMFMMEEKYGFISVLKSVETNRDVENSKMQYKILLLKEVVEDVKESATLGKIFTVRFVFECEGQGYYYEIKNKQLAEVCVNNPRITINCMVYLGDVDIAKEQLVGKVFFNKATGARIDDSNSSSGYRDVTIPVNTEVTVTDVGVGNRECPVKVIFEDKDGNSYYRNLTFSRINSGLLESDLKGANLNKSFPNVFTFANKQVQAKENTQKKYVGSDAYPQQTLEVNKKDGGMQTLLRYTPVVIRELEPGQGSMATLTLADREGNIYTTTVNMRYDSTLKNADFIDDLFGFKDLRKQYPSITEENWVLLGRGDIKVGMTRDEARLSLGPAVRIEVQPGNAGETWYYHGKILTFDGDKIVKIR